MQEKLTISISSETKKLMKRHARQQNKTVSRFLEDLFVAALKKEPKKLGKNKWVEKTAGTYNMGSKNVLDELFSNLIK